MKADPDVSATHSASPSAAHREEPALEPLPIGVRRRERERYQIISEHGRGGLGRVSRAHDRELGRDVAIKELIARGNLGEVRFLREALITARLEHPGIVPVHEAGQWPDGTPFYAMKLVAGRPLRELIAERATVEQRLGLLHHVIAVADAIAYAHGRHIIHRDLKPSNVVVGDYGETIVIDWGLAKDLSTSEPAVAGDGPFRTPADSELTAAGDVLGTPAYMAPEQSRGEPVDQRADVFAIGAMLWELCSLRRVPPSDAVARRRVLRKAGIDPDLITIVDKALASDPAQRYPDAGALVADLRAFESGARIAARRYSLLAMLVHWTRRHRAIAISAAAVAVLATAGAIWSFANIAAQRDRADAARQRTEATEQALQAEHAELTLKHAELLLTTDPSAAIDTLAGYHGRDALRADQLRAEAIGRGVAQLRVTPHADYLYWIAATPGGGLVSLTRDGAITRTAADGSSVMIAKASAPTELRAYAEAPGLFAYACDRDAVCVLDVQHGSPQPIAALRASQLEGMELSLDGTKLAASSKSGTLQLFDLTPLRRSPPGAAVEAFHVQLGESGPLLFVADDEVAFGTVPGATLVGPGRAPRRYVAPGGSYWDTDPAGHQLVFGTTRGRASVLDTATLRVTAQIELCHELVSGVKLIPGRRAVAYTCQDGTLGTWDLRTGALAVHGHGAGRPSLLTVSADGQFVLAAGNQTVFVLDRETGLVATYLGHRYPLSAIAPPLAGGATFATGDSRGSVRVWPLPRRTARVAGDFRFPVASTAYDDLLGTAILSSVGSDLSWFAAPGEPARTAPRLADNIAIVRSDTGQRFATRGENSGAVELWSAATMTRTRVLETHQGGVLDVALDDATGEVITAGTDGQLLVWTDSDEPRVLARLERAIARFVRAPSTGAIVATTADGALWRIARDGRVSPLRAGGGASSTLAVTSMIAIPHSPAIAVGYTDGEVVMIDAQAGRIDSLLHAPEAIRGLAVTPDGRTIAIAANDDTVRVGVRSGEDWRGVTWTVLATRARRMALTPDGLLVMICNDGIVWLYATTDRRWSCLSTGVANLLLLVTSADGRVAVATDRDGRNVRIDLQRARDDGPRAPTTF